MAKAKDKKEVREKAKTPIGYSVLDVFRDKSRIEFIENTTVNIEGSRGVVEYSDELIKINLGYTCVSFHGRKLNLKCISPSVLVIEGFITAAEFGV